MIEIELFSLEPIGIGTAMVESLTSYLSRLAEAHCVTVGTLISQAIAEELRKNYIIASSQKRGSRLYENAFTLNGMGSLTEEFIRAITNLTGRDVSFLTLQSWRNMCPDRNILRTTKAWCPNCLEDWKRKRLPIYEPLVWCFKDVELCKIHNALLITDCPSCDSRIPLLNRTSRNGFCSHCNRWLGSADVLDMDMESDHMSWGHFVISNIEDILKKQPYLNITTNSIKDFIVELINQAGGIIGFANYFGIAKSMVSEWYKELHRPSFTMLLKVCYSVNINLLSAISNELSIHFIDKPVFSSSKQKTVRRKIDWEKVREVLVDKLNNGENASPSVKAVAQAMNIDRRLLYSHFPDLCNELSSNYSSRIQMMKDKRIEEGLEEIRKVIINAKNIGAPLNRGSIEKLLPPTVSLREKPFLDLWKSLS